MATAIDVKRILFRLLSFISYLPLLLLVNKLKTIDQHLVVGEIGVPDHRYVLAADPRKFGISLRLRIPDFSFRRARFAGEIKDQRLAYRTVRGFALPCGIFQFFHRGAA